MNVVSNFKNSLLHRSEIVITMTSQANPSYDECAELISKEVGTEKDLVVVKHVRGAYGSHEFTVEAFVYASAESKQSVEPQPKKKEASA